MYQAIFFGSSPDLTGRPLGMYRVASHLRHLGFSVKCLWTWSEFPDSDWQETMERHVGPDTVMVAISATVMFRDLDDGERRFFGVSNEEFRRRCTAIKKQAPNCRIVVGGAQISFADPAWLKTFQEVDYFISGQGESLSTYLLENFLKNQRPALPDIIRPYVVTDSSMPFQEFSTSLTRWEKHDSIFPKEPLPLELSRGCIFKCSFCSYDLTGKNPEDFIRQSNRVREELLYNHDEFGTDTYFLSDDLINESDYKINMIYDVAQSLPFPIHFTGYLRLDLVRRFPAAFQKLLDIGLYGGFFGIETLNDTSGRAVGKGLGVNRIMEGLALIHDKCGDDFYGEAGMILGLPNDDPDTRYKILDWSQDSLVSKVIRKISIQPLGISTQHGWSEIDRDPKKFGYDVSPAEKSKSRRLNTDAWRTAKYSSEQAAIDAGWTWNQMFNLNPWGQFAGAWRLPWMMYLSRNEGGQLLENIRQRKNNLQDFTAWVKEIYQKDNIEHTNYLKNMRDHA